MLKRSSFFIILIFVFAFVGCSSTNEANNKGKNKKEVSDNVKEEVIVDQTEKLGFEEWSNQELVWPNWSEPKAVELNDEIKYARYSTRSGLDIASIEDTLKTLRFLIENTKASEDYPMYYYWMYSLGEGMIKVGEYQIGYHYLEILNELPNETIVMQYVRGEETIIYTKEDFKMEDSIIAVEMKLLALVGYNEKAKDIFKKFTYSDSMDTATVAYALGVMGETDLAYETYKKAIDPNNYQDSDHLRSSSSNISAASFAYLNGDYDKVFEMTDFILSEGVDSRNPLYFGEFDENRSTFPVRHWTSSYGQVEDYRELAKIGKNKNVGNFEGLKDGEFKGSTISYMQTPVEVTITVANGKVTNINVFQDTPQDDRSSSAFEIVSDRILKNQSVNVDTVSGATISSESVKIGVLKALLNSKK